MTLVLILLGALPFVFGGVQNWYMITHSSCRPGKMKPAVG